MPAPNRDQMRLLLRDIPAAFGLLTRIPVPFTAPRPQGAWAWPLVGGAVNAAALAMGALALWAGASVAVVAVLVIALQVMLTGGLHEDGLADCADGFFGGHSTARRLEIMKDSQIGSFGALALMLAVLARWAALVALISAGEWALIVIAGGLARAPMAAVMAVLPNARGHGLAASVGAPPIDAAVVAGGLAVATAMLIAGGTGLAMVLAAGLAAVAVALVARAKIGGQTGDVLGAVAVLAEIAALGTAA